MYKLEVGVFMYHYFTNLGALDKCNIIPNFFQKN